MPNPLHGVTDPASAKYLANAIDLSSLAQPTSPADEPEHEENTEGTPREFRVAIVGDHRGRPRVMLAFGHLQWVFEPRLALDLGTVLADAAQQAEQIAPQAPNLTPTSTSGLLP